MRKLLMLLLCAAFIFTLALSVSADTSATKMVVYATVGADGVCQVTTNVSLHLDHAEEDIMFPVPAQADHVCLNNTRIRTHQSGDAQLINLSGALNGMAGELNFTVTYNLSDVIKTSEADTPQLELPLMSGFAHPVELLEFHVTLPGEVTAKPAFSSGYHQASIEQDLSATVSGATVSGQSIKTLKDHETLVMTLAVSEEMFPSTALSLKDTLFDDIAMAVCGVLALLFWILFMRTAPVFGEKTPNPPVGYSAGELGSVLTLQGAQLDMMILTWAQLGYILIQMDRNQRVLLHKRMEMGNERCSFEQRCFQNLFAGKQVVDTTSRRYAIYSKKVEVLSSNVKPLISKKSGNLKIFRFLCTGIAAFGGMALGVALGSGALLQWFWAIVLAVLGAISSMHIQKWADALFLLDRRKVWIALTLCGVWILLGLIGGAVLVGILVPLSQLVAGLMSGFGIRRTEEGRQVMAQTLGLRRYLMKIDPQEMDVLLQHDPDFFHNIAPYALALGMDKILAKQFGKQGLHACPYLTTGMDGHRTAMEWSTLMRKVVEAMNRRRKQMPIEHLQNILASFRK